MRLCGASGGRRSRNRSNGSLRSALGRRTRRRYTAGTCCHARGGGGHARTRGCGSRDATWRQPLARLARRANGGGGGCPPLWYARSSSWSRRRGRLRRAHFAGSLLARTAVQQAVLTAPTPHTADYLGVAVAVSGDTAVVGAPEYDPAAGSDAGAAFVYVRAGGVWTWQATLTAADGDAYDQFGTAVALSGDTALVGAPWGDADVDGSGAAYVFTRTGSTWTQQQKLDLTGEANFRDKFGDAVALSGDTAVIGAPERGTLARRRRRRGLRLPALRRVLGRQAQLTAADGADDDFFGCRRGRQRRHGGGGGGRAFHRRRHRRRRRVRLCQRSGITWAPQAKLAPSDPGAGGGLRLRGRGVRRDGAGRRALPHRAGGLHLRRRLRVRPLGADVVGAGQAARSGPRRSRTGSAPRSRSPATSRWSGHCSAT